MPRLCRSAEFHGCRKNAMRILRQQHNRARQSICFGDRTGFCFRWHWLSRRRSRSATVRAHADANEPANGSAPGRSRQASSRNSDDRYHHRRFYFHFRIGSDPSRDSIRDHCRDRRRAFVDVGDYTVWCARVRSTTPFRRSVPSNYREKRSASIWYENCFVRI